MDNTTATSTGLTKPTRSFVIELETITKNKGPVSAMNELEMALAASNPITTLNLTDFLTVLQLAVQTQDFTTGSANTKTVIEMRRGLRILMGEKVSGPVSSPFSWAASVKLLGPFLACIYQRMHAELQLVDALELPQISADL